MKKQLMECAAVTEVRLLCCDAHSFSLCCVSAAAVGRLLFDGYEIFGTDSTSTNLAIIFLKSISKN